VVKKTGSSNSMAFLDQIAANNNSSEEFKRGESLLNIQRTPNYFTGMNTSRYDNGIQTSHSSRKSKIISGAI
jgi:hypothetical protein